MNSETTTIGIAVVEQDGCYFVGTRNHTGDLPGYDEFPGGKCKPGETPKACAARECEEETGLDVLPVELLLRRTYSYPHGDVDLHFWKCRLNSTAQLSETFQGFRWIPTAELKSLQFPEANDELISLLVANSP